MKTFLVTTDFSEESQKAFALAKQMAKHFGAKILLLSVMENPAQAAMVYAIDFPVFPDPNIQKELKEKLNTKLEETRSKHFQDAQIECHLIEAHGAIDSEILSFAKSNSVDLIVMATHGRTGISRLLIGSVAERVVRSAHCPVLTVPAR